MAGRAFGEFVRGGALAYLGGGSAGRALLAGACAAVGAAVVLPDAAEAHWRRDPAAQSGSVPSIRTGRSAWNGSRTFVRPAPATVVVATPAYPAYGSQLYGNVAYPPVAPAFSPSVAGLGASGAYARAYGDDIYGARAEAAAVPHQESDSVAFDAAIRRMPRF